MARIKETRNEEISQIQQAGTGADLMEIMWPTQVSPYVAMPKTQSDRHFPVQLTPNRAYRRLKQTRRKEASVCFPAHEINPLRNQTLRVTSLPSPAPSCLLCCIASSLLLSKRRRLLELHKRFAHPPNHSQQHQLQPRSTDQKDHAQDHGDLLQLNHLRPAGWAPGPKSTFATAR